MKTIQLNKDKPPVNDKPPVLVLGTGITVLGLIRSLGMAGVSAYCLSKNPGIEAYSKWYKTLPSLDLIAEGEPLDSYLEVIMLPKAVLMPCNDHWTHKAGSLNESLKKRFLLSQSTLETQKLFTDKASFASVLSSCNIPHPETIVLESEKDIPQFKDKTLSQYFLKPRDSQSFNDHFKEKAFNISSRESCISSLKKCADRGFKMVLQRYVQGLPSDHYFIEGMVDRHGTIKSAFARRRLRMFPLRFGNTSAMVSIDPAPLQETIEGLQRLFKKVNYRGIYSGEFKRDRRDKKYKLLEINARPWWYNEFATHCGINVAKMAYDDALGKDVPLITDYLQGQRFANGYNDLRAFFADKNGEKTFKNFFQTCLFSRFTIVSKEDPLPGIMWLVNSGVSRSRAILRNLGGRLRGKPAKVSSAS